MNKAQIKVKKSIVVDLTDQISIVGVLEERSGLESIVCHGIVDNRRVGVHEAYGRAQASLSTMRFVAKVIEKELL